MDVEVEAGGVKIPAKALIDTGAQTCLVKKGLLPEAVFRAAERPLVLRTVSGEAIPGGQREAIFRG